MKRAPLDRHFLLALFAALRQAGIKPGVEELLDSLRLVEAGFGLADQESLRHTLKALWLTDEGQFSNFDKLFNQQLEVVKSLSAARVVLEEERSVFADGGRSQKIEVREEEKSDLLEEPSSVRESIRLWGGNLAVARREKEEGWGTGEDDEPSAEAVSHKGDGMGARHWGIKPLSYRELVQGWRRVRQLRPDLQKGRSIPDLPATMAQVAREGFFLEPVLVPPLSNRAVLFLLTDHQGSMAPFDFAGDLLAQAAGEQGGFRKFTRYYFRNDPEGRLFTDSFHDQEIQEEFFFDQVRALKAAVVVFSDAGAARNRRNPERIAATGAFLEKLAGVTRRFCWINPLPAERWRFNSAEAIQQQVDMFPLKREGFYRAMRTLIRGGSRKWGGSDATQQGVSHVA